MTPCGDFHLFEPLFLRRLFFLSVLYHFLRVVADLREKTNMVDEEAASEAASESEFDAEGIETQPEEQSDDILPENEDDSDSLMLCFYENGSYVISRDPETEGLVSQVSYNDKSTSMYIVQCYKNGHVNNNSSLSFQLFMQNL